MSKNIVICSDGTGNSAIKGRGTNVFKIFECVDLNGHRYDHALTVQLAIYDDGVGTESFRPLRMLGGAAGWGLSRNVKQLYEELCRIYDPGDRIFLFGFSRGAFTVRTLAGLITTCGIINATQRSRSSDVSASSGSAAVEIQNSQQLRTLVDKAYKILRRCFRTWLMRALFGPPTKGESKAFRRAHCHGNEKIAFVGVWDTVDAVGLPLNIANVVNTFIYQFKFPNYELSPDVERGYHALAIDDERQSFHPLLWDQRKENQGQIIEQVWFTGVHSNVGGGYPRQGMSLVPLDWLMQKAESTGLRFVAEERKYYRDHANVDDKLYNSRAGIALFYRWLPRDIAKLCAKNNVPPVLHSTVLERITHGTENYRPGNLPGNASVVFTRSGEDDKDDAAHARAKALQKVLSEAHSKLPSVPVNGSLLDSVRRYVHIGRLSYRVFLLTVIGLIVTAAALIHPAASLGWSLLTSIAKLLFGLIGSPIDTSIAIARALVDTPWAIASISVGSLLALLLSWWSGRGMDRAFSQFWFKEQQALRRELKRTRLKPRTATAGQERGVTEDTTPSLTESERLAHGRAARVVEESR
ncbi:MAG: DUF2235 domain-containing protein [Steroidobacteraceae bacterium]